MQRGKFNKTLTAVTKRWSSESIYSKRVPNHKFHPETLALSYGYNPSESKFAIKPPLYLSSTWQFENAQIGKDTFAEVFGIGGKQPTDKTPFVYSRLNNPNLKIYEDRLACCEERDHGKALTFASGMSAITTVATALLKPGDHVVITRPIYGGTDAYFEKIIPKFGVHSHFIQVGDTAPQALEKICEENDWNVRLCIVETPSNPSNIHTDIEAMSKILKKCDEKRGIAENDTENRSLLGIDNTFIGPIFQAPHLFGADFTVYSATKFLGGHSDLVAGAIICDESLYPSFMFYRTILGTMSQPFVAWMLLRSIETLVIRMKQAQSNAIEIAKILELHPAVKSVSYSTLLPENSNQAKIFKKQCKGPGSLITFDIDGDESDCFKVLNAFEVFHLAVSLGGTESLVEHPSTMTHADCSQEMLKSFGVNESTIRISVGIEHIEDLKKDLIQALNTIAKYPLKL